MRRRKRNGILPMSRAAPSQLLVLHGRSVAILDLSLDRLLLLEQFVTTWNVFHSDSTRCFNLGAQSLRPRYNLVFQCLLLQNLWAISDAVGSFELSRAKLRLRSLLCRLGQGRLRSCLCRKMLLVTEQGMLEHWVIWRSLELIISNTLHHSRFMKFHVIQINWKSKSFGRPWSVVCYLGLQFERFFGSS